MRDKGSFDPGPPGPTQVVFATTDAQQGVLAQRCDALETQFKTAPSDALIPLALDLRGMHRALFDGLCPSLPIAVGTFRGAPGTALETAQRVVVTRGALAGLQKTDPCLAPAHVAAEMAALTNDITAFWRHPASADAVARLSGFTHRVFWIHPFLDGNGHVWRLCMVALARRAGLLVSPAWRINTRPYGPGFSLALQSYARDPAPLNAQLSLFLTSA